MAPRSSACSRPTTCRKPPSFDELAGALLAPEGEDRSFRHAPETPVNFVPGGMERGRNLFGPGEPAAIFRGTSGAMRAVTSSALHGVILSGQSTTVHSMARGFYEPSVRLLAQGGRHASIARLEPFYAADQDGQVRVRGRQPND